MTYKQSLEFLAQKISQEYENSYDMFEQLLQQAQPQIRRYRPQKSVQSSVGMRHHSSQFA